MTDFTKMELLIATTKAWHRIFTAHNIRSPLKALTRRTWTGKKGSGTYLNTR